MSAWWNNASEEDFSPRKGQPYGHSPTVAKIQPVVPEVTLYSTYNKHRSGQQHQDLQHQQKRPDEGFFSFPSSSKLPETASLGKAGEDNTPNIPHSFDTTSLDTTKRPTKDVTAYLKWQNDQITKLQMMLNDLLLNKTNRATKTVATQTSSTRGTFEHQSKRDVGVQASSPSLERGSKNNDINDDRIRHGAMPRFGQEVRNNSIHDHSDLQIDLARGNPFDSDYDDEVDGSELKQLKNIEPKAKSCSQTTVTSERLKEYGLSFLDKGDLVPKVKDNKVFKGSSPTFESAFDNFYPTPSQYFGRVTETVSDTSLMVNTAALKHLDDAHLAHVARRQLNRGQVVGRQVAGDHVIDNIGGVTEVGLGDAFLSMDTRRFLEKNKLLQS